MIEKTELIQMEGTVESKRGTRYPVNPFVASASCNTKIGTKRISNKTGDKLMIVSQETGEIMAPAGFHEVLEVDKTQFVKLFKNGVKAFTGLSSAGAKVFSVLYDEMQKSHSQDFVYLSFHLLEQTEGIKEATFYRGMKELLKLNFIAESLVPYKYFVNPDYLWNGDRLAFIKEFRLKSTTKIKDDKTKDLFNNED